MSQSLGIAHRLLTRRYFDLRQARPREILHPRRVRSNGSDCLHLSPDFWSVPPIVELDPHSGMICHPFADESLSGRIATVTIHYQDAFEPLLCRRIENITYHRHIAFKPKSDRSRKRTEIRRNAIGEDGKHGNA